MGAVASECNVPLRDRAVMSLKGSCRWHDWRCGTSCGSADAAAKRPWVIGSAGTPACHPHTIPPRKPPFRPHELHIIASTTLMWAPKRGSSTGNCTQPQCLDVTPCPHRLCNVLMAHNRGR